jgi:hypothetical protein
VTQFGPQRNLVSVSVTYGVRTNHGPGKRRLCPHLFLAGPLKRFAKGLDPDLLNEQDVEAAKMSEKAFKETIEVSADCRGVCELSEEEERQRPSEHAPGWWCECVGKRCQAALSQPDAHDAGLSKARG